MINLLSKEYEHYITKIRTHCATLGVQLVRRDAHVRGRRLSQVLAIVAKEG